MKEFLNYEDEIYKCSRCGLCQTVCPVYKATLNECALSRGKFNILNGIIKGELKFSDRVKKYLDLCTGCNACKEFCPSGIDARKIFIAAKNEYYKNQKQTLLQKFLNSYVLFKTLLICLGIIAFIFRCFGISQIIKFSEKFLLKFGWFGKKLLLLNLLVMHKYNAKNIYSPKINGQKALYFDGCFNKYINNDTKNAVKNILNQCDISVVDSKFECCAISYFHDGNIDEFKKLIEQNLKEFDESCDYIITDCASCNAVLKQYKDFNESQKALMFSNKVISAVDLIKNIQFESTKTLNVALHKPCHDNSDFINIVKNIKGINFIEIENYDKCCGFSGKFALQNPKISQEISRQKIKNYLNKNIDYIITTCPACLLGLNQGLTEIDEPDKPEAINLFVFLAEYCKPST